MTRFRNADTAATYAAELGELHGFCVFDGMTYVGTRPQLEALSCLYITDPATDDTVSEG